MLYIVHILGDENKRSFDSAREQKNGIIVVPLIHKLRVEYCSTTIELSFTTIYGRFFQSDG